MELFEITCANTDILPLHSSEGVGSASVTKHVSDNHFFAPIVTSWDSRITVDCLDPPNDGDPRCTGTLANFSGQPSRLRSGAVSGSKSGFVEFSLSFICLPHADDSNLFVA